VPATGSRGKPGNVWAMGIIARRRLSQLVFMTAAAACNGSNGSSGNGTASGGSNGPTSGGSTGSATPGTTGTTGGTSTTGKATTGSTTTGTATTGGTTTGGTTTGAGTTGGGLEAFDDFERSELGPAWRVVFPPPPNDTQVQILDDSDLGMGPGPQGFFLVNWVGSSFAPDQFCEATIPLDAGPDWIYQVYVRWREDDAARYGFHYNGDPGQDTFGQWVFKYDGVPSPETRIIASTPATTIPGPGDTLRVEVEGFTLRGYLNGELVLEAEDTDPSRIAAGEVGLAARWATGNMGTPAPVKVYEAWAGGEL